MIRKDIEKLLKANEPSIVSILVARGLVTLKKGSVLKFSNLTLTDKAKNQLGISDLLITDDYINSLRNVFPQAYRSTTDTVRTKLTELMLDHDLDLERVLHATRIWCKDKVPPYCGNISNFIWKDERGVVVSRLLECYESIGSVQDNPVNTQPLGSKNSRLEKLKQQIDDSEK